MLQHTLDLVDEVAEPTVADADLAVCGGDRRDGGRTVTVL